MGGYEVRGGKMGRDGISVLHGLPKLMKYIVGLNKKQPIKKVVDFGCGKGELGKVIRTYLPSVELLVGVDIWAATIRRRRQDLPKIYDEAIVLDFREILKGPTKLDQLSSTWDLWMFGDCLEHVEKEKALSLLTLESSRYIAARFPVGDWKQGAVGGNTAETHLWSFYPTELLNVNRPPIFCLTACSKDKAKKLSIPQEIEGMVHNDAFKSTQTYVTNAIFGDDQ